MTLGIIGLYLAGVLVVGTLSHRLFRGTGEDYFVATRTIGPFVLLMSLFGTNMTAFSILGASGEAYRRGIGVFALMASSSAIVIPVVFFFVGIRMWAAGKRHGFLTQAQLFRARWGSDAVGLLLFAVLILLIVPYLLIGVKGGGLTLTNITGGAVPPWVGGLLISAVVVTYVTYGGLRGTAWANTFQTLVFMTLGAVTVVYVVRRLGGLDAALDAVQAGHPQLLIEGGGIRPLELLSYTLIPLSAGMFPHLFQHWLSARRPEAFRLSMVAYPLCMLVVWLPSVLLGVLGRIDFPDLSGPAAGGVLIRLIHHHAPDLLAGLLGAGVFAAVMSSLDSQVLSVGTMFTQDVVRHYGFHDRMSERAQILSGRLFVIAVVALTYLLSLHLDATIFGLAVWSFSGFAALLPLAVAALYWRRSNATGAVAAIAVTAVTWIAFFLHGHGVPGYTVGGSGILPVVVMVAASSLALIAGSLLGRPTEPERVERFFGDGAEPS
ncbi:MAG: sodium:solute symporter family protein [Acidobacteria bacterium]|nr:MAG: sodium:solute symporter family protein [Acidobacteriota bacterium]